MSVNGKQILRRRVTPGRLVALSGLGVAGAALSVLASAGPAFASGTSTLTCSSTGVADECATATAYASSHHPGSGQTTVLAVEADTELHGGSVPQSVFDIRVKAPNGTIYVEHVLRSESSDSVWWESVAEGQNPPPQPPPPPPPPSGGGGGTAHISASQAESAATSFVQSNFSGVGVLGVKKIQLNANAPKLYYQVKLQLGSNGRRSGTTNVWVDASTSSAVVTAVQGSGLSYRDTNVISSSAATSDAMAAIGGSDTTYNSTQLNGGKWQWYWVFVRNSAGTKYKVGIDAATGAMTQARAS